MPKDRTPGRVLGRRRRENAPGGRERLCDVWATPDERAVLEARCAEAGVTVPRLLMESALSGGGETPSERRALLVELFAVRRLLAGVASNLNQAARAANVGDGFPVEEARGALFELRRLAGPGGRIDAAIDVVAAEGVSAS